MTERIDRLKISDAAYQLLKALQLPVDTDPNLKETPFRISRMYVDELCSGLYERRPLMTAFPKPPEADQMITVGPLVVHSLCPHHFAPILGHAWVGIIPGSSLLGLSKYARLVRWCAARPIMQETLTAMIADELEVALPDAIGVGVIIKAEHLCMKWRGVRESQALTTTSAMRGAFLTGGGAREEFMRFAR
jgi:GTP cyclohydrolase I